MSGSIAARPFLSYSSYLRRRYGGRVYRVAVDAGFGCPHRQCGRGPGGCTYCDEYGSRAAYSLDRPEAGVETQIRDAVAFLRARYDARIYLLYFQAYTNTDAPVGVLRSLYDNALGVAPFRELIVATRPDRVDRERADLLASYRRDDFDVWVELGLQSAHNRTLRRIRRGHDLACFEQAYHLLKERGIRTAVHLIFGLPGEGWQEIERTIRYVAALEPDGIKIHNLQIPIASELCKEYLLGELSVPCAGRHEEYVIRALEMLPPRTVIMRITSDFSYGRVAAPRGFMPKGAFYDSVRKEMLRRRTFQGRLSLCP